MVLIEFSGNGCAYAWMTEHMAHMNVSGFF